MKILFSIFFLFLCLQVFTQNGQTKRAIQSYNGKPDKQEWADDGMYFIGYEEKYYSEYSKTTESYFIGYFFTSSSDTAICKYWMWVMPKNEANSFVNILNEKYVKVKDSVWKDYTNNDLIEMQIDGSFCKITYTSLN